jgi:hypothetical protein
MPSRWHDYLWQRTPIISDTFYLSNRELLWSDPQTESGDSNHIANLKAVGITSSSVYAFEENQLLKMGFSKSEAQKYMELEFPRAGHIPR